MTITEQALEILNKPEFAEFLAMPTSLSGKHHHGETHKEHAEAIANAMRHFCKEFNINSEDTDMLVAACLLHDIGLAEICIKGNYSFNCNDDNNGKTFSGTNCTPCYGKFFIETGYTRIEPQMKFHPLISAEVIDRYDIERKEEIKRLVSVHMSHWYKECPQPQNLYEYLICLADYVVTYGKMNEFKGE